MRIRAETAVLLLACAWSFSCRSTQTLDPQLTERIRSLEAENAELRKRIAEPQTHPQQSQPSGPEKVPATKSHDRSAQEVAAARAEAEQFRHDVHTLRSQLTEERQRTGDLEGRLSELQTQVSAAAAQRVRFSAAETESRQALAEANRHLEALRAEMNTQKDVVTQLEAANARLRKAAGQDQTALLAEMQDVVVRREQYIDNLLRRYRELTDYYRTLAGTFDGRHDRESVAPNGAEFSRIQNTLASAEEDMRQLTSLNARMQLIRRRLNPGAAAAAGRK
jgi:chromosome segregation ATPase